MLSDFDSFSSDGSSQFILNLLTPLVGSGSARMTQPNGGHMNAGSDGGTYVRGFTMVRYETLTYIELSGIATATARVGITAMQSHHNLTGTGKSFYFFGLENTGVNFNTANFVLYKTTNGWGSVATVINSVAVGSSVYQNLRSLRLDCITDVPNLGGVWLRGYAGTTSGFTGMSTIFSTVDFSSPLTTTVNEGIAVDCASTGSTLNVLFDQVSLYEIT